MKRRHFIQSASAALSAIGLSQLQLQHHALRYARTLAQPTPRKLALLVGVNTYAADITASLDAEPLLGAVNDVELQRQLLMHRFGFNPHDIITLTDTQATRQAILTAYEEHLVQQAKPGDIVVFHFSGHGAQVQELDACDVQADCVNSSIVPHDYNQASDEGAVQDIMGHTRFLLDSAFQTEQVTIVLDCCYSGGGKRGNVVMRSRLTDSQVRSGLPPKISAKEWDYQESWLSRLGWSRDQFIEKRQAGVAKGVVITSASRQQKAADYPFEKFYAGAFTYLLTKYLWQLAAPQSVSQVIRQVSRSTSRLSQHFQIPEYEPLTGDIVDRQSLYQSPQTAPPGEAVITQVGADNRVNLWLGGLDAQSLAAFDQKAVFALLDQTSGELKGEVTQDALRTGLETSGIVTLMEGHRVQVGDLLQERIRSIPERIPLRVGLDPSLPGDPSAVTQQLTAKMDFLEVFPVQSGEALQIIFGRFTADNRNQLDSSTSALPADNSLGLFNAMLEPIVSSFDQPDEPIEAAIDRLQPMFKSLLLGRMLRLLLNGETSHLNVSVSVEATRGRGASILAVPPRSRGAADIIIPTLTEGGIEVIAVETQLRLKIRNGETRDLYMSMIVIDANGTINVLFPYTWDAPEDQTLVKAGGEIDFPLIKAVPPLGLTELMVIASTHPLQRALKTMERLAPPNLRGAVTLTEPDEVMTALFADLDRRRGDPSPAANGPASQIDTTQLAAVSLLYKVVAQ